MDHAGGFHLVTIITFLSIVSGFIEWAHMEPTKQEVKVGQTRGFTVEGDIYEFIDRVELMSQPKRFITDRFY